MPFPEVMPEFKGGDKAMKLFIKKNLRLPASLDSSGKVCVGFIVETTGELTNLKIFKSLNNECDAEAIRLILSMPRWMPGSINGKDYRIPLSYCLTFDNK